MVNPMPCMGDPGQGPLVVLSLKPQVPLHHHHNLRKAKHLPLPDTHNMALAEGELLVGFCQENQLYNIISCQVVWETETVTHVVMRYKKI